MANRAQREKEYEMFGKSKDGMTDSEQVAVPVQQFQRPSVVPSPAPGAADEISSISSGMSVVGKISGEGTVKVLGRIEGELHATTVLISQGAQVEGDIVAEDVSVGGHVKGTIRANRVKLNGSATVEGDIFHRSLSIEENARFEGSSRRDDAVIETPRIPLSRPPAQSHNQSHAAATDSSQKLNGAPDSAAHAPATK
jgi:cytoskeletal protein CcmA (bactofilin family)